MYGKRGIALIVTLAVAAGCATGGGPSSPSSGGPVAQSVPIGWPVRSAEYVDLWLHGYALLTADTAKVPLYERGYRERMLGVRRERNVTTALDANREALQAGFVRNPGLVNGQFAIFSFASFDELVRVTQLFVQNDGSPTTVTDPTTQLLFYSLREYFKTVSDRDWLRLFVASLQEEQTRFYQSYWSALQADRLPVRQAVETSWLGTYRAKFQRFLRNERLVDGTFILALPLGGEGRTVISAQLGNGVTVPFPATTDSAMNALYVFAHEIVGTAAARALEDNVTPADKRAGALERYQTIAAVRAGSILLQRIAPELVTGYQRYYLRVAGESVPSGDPNTAFVAAFGLPDQLREGIIRQIDLILAGI